MKLLTCTGPGNMIIVYVVARMLQLAGKLRQKWYARAGTNFTKPRTSIISGSCLVCVCVCVYAKIFNPSISNTPIVTVSAVSKTIEKV